MVNLLPEALHLHDPLADDSLCTGSVLQIPRRRKVIRVRMCIEDPLDCEIVINDEGQ